MLAAEFSQAQLLPQFIRLLEERAATGGEAAVSGT